MKQAGRPAQDRQEMVKMLVEAALLGDTAAAKKYKVTTRTLQNYRKLLKDDPTFFALFQQTGNNLLTRPWAEDLNDGLKRTIEKIIEMVEAQNKRNPAALEAVVKAFSAMAEMQLAKEVLSAASGEQDAAPSEASREAQTGATTYN
jgi:AcrR family transcriptional regulator